MSRKAGPCLPGRKHHSWHYRGAGGRFKTCRYCGAPNPSWTEYDEKLRNKRLGIEVEEVHKDLKREGEKKCEICGEDL